MPRYEFVEGTSSKFWEITLEGSAFTTRYGKIGAAGQSTTKTFGSEGEAHKEYAKLVAEKTKKGYVLVDGGDAAPAPAPTAAPKAAPKAEPGKGKGKKAEAEAPAASAPAPAAASGALRFELVEGTSSKFWEISRSGSALTVRYGKIGSAGQTTLKELESEADAQKEQQKLIAEKTKKGYVQASGGAGGGDGDPSPGASGRAPAAHAKAGTAFRMSDLEQLDGPVYGEEDDDGEGRGPTFMGLKRVDYDPEEGIKDPARRAWRLRVEFDDGVQGWIELLEKFTADPNAGKVKALVVGNWGEELATSGGADTGGAVRLRDALCAAKDKLTSLAALFVNDVVAEECEISWQNFCDPAPLLVAYPELQHLRVRGDTGSFGAVRHERLRSLQLEGSNLRNAVLQGLALADLPALEHLEVWLGPDDYAERKEMADLLPLLSGKLFPALRYLGLRDSDQADDVARTVAQAPLLERLEVLDLSLGTLSDAGAEALLSSPAIARLQKLDLRHHYVSDALLKKLKALKPVKVTESRSDQEPDEYNGEVHRYVAVGE